VLLLSQLPQAALSFILQDSCAKVHRKLTLTSFKTADEKSSIGNIVYQWKPEFEESRQEMLVAVIVNEGMTTGYPLYTWAMRYPSRSMSSDGSDGQLLSATDQFERSRRHHELERRMVHTRIAKFSFFHATKLHFNHAKIRNCIMPRAGQYSSD